MKNCYKNPMIKYLLILLTLIFTTPCFAGDDEGRYDFSGKWGFDRSNDDEKEDLIFYEVTKNGEKYDIDLPHLFIDDNAHLFHRLKVDSWYSNRTEYFFSITGESKVDYNEYAACHLETKIYLIFNPGIEGKVFTKEMIVMQTIIIKELCSTSGTGLEVVKSEKEILEKKNKYGLTLIE